MNTKTKIAIGVILVAMIFTAFVIVNSKQASAAPQGNGSYECWQLCKRGFLFCLNNCGGSVICTENCWGLYNKCVNNCYGKPPNSQLI